MGPPRQGILTAAATECRFEPFGPDIPPLQAATYVNDRWIALASDSSLVEIPSKGAVEVHDLSGSNLAGILSYTSDSLPVWMAPAGAGFIVAMRAPPFSWEFVHSIPNWKHGGTAGPPTEHVGPESTSTGAVFLRDQVLQVIADLTSNRRRLLLFDLNGRLKRESEIETPVGFLAVNEAKQNLLALRRTDILEVVIYEYSSIN